MEHDKHDLEKLNKSQLVLLTLFVSFMTSIATGIVTVSLMEQAPPAITETVNRVVERTVERVVPGQVASAAEPIVKTVVVKEAELIPKALETASPSIVRLYSGVATSSVFLGLGVVLDGEGTIATDAGLVGGTTKIEVEFDGSLRVPSVVSDTNEKLGVAYLRGATSTSKGPVHWKPAQVAPGNPMLGQTVVMVAGRSAARVAQGLITALSPLEEGGKNLVLETDVSNDVIMLGSPIINTEGAVLGISTRVSRAADASGFLAVEALFAKAEVEEVQTEEQ